MKLAVFHAVLARLTEDPVLQDYLGDGQIVRAKAGAPAQLPAITLQENNESSRPDVSYATFRTRTNDPVLQVDIWVRENREEFPSTGEDLETIANRVDAVLLDAAAPVSGTRLWRKISGSQQFEADTKIWHAALRYAFQYRLTDTEGENNDS